jgi:hypothetical protein
MEHSIRRALLALRLADLTWRWVVATVVASSSWLVCRTRQWRSSAPTGLAALVGADVVTPPSLWAPFLVARFPREEL